MCCCLILLQGQVGIDSFYPGDTLMWNHIMASGAPLQFPAAPRGVILPHHAITTTAVARFYRGLQKVIQPQTIFLIGPNHFDSGKHNIQTMDSCVYNTVYGELKVDSGYVRQLVQNGIVFRDDRAFLREHAVFFHAPFIKRFFPRAKIVPIIIKWGTGTAELDALVHELSQIIPADALVLASVDFSHYNFKEVADFHDITSYTTISNFNYSGLFSLEIDSPASIYVIEKLMAAFGCKRAVRLLHTNSDDFTHTKEQRSTSHQYFAFFPGKAERRENITVLAAGDIRTKNRVLFLRTQWPWDRGYRQDKDTTVTRFLKDLRGEEDRFFMGYDLYIFDLPETDKVYSFSKNGITVNLLKLNERDGQAGGSGAQAARIREAAKNADHLIVLYQFNGGGGISAPRKQAVRGFIDNGADIILGRGPEGAAVDAAHMEYYKRKLIMYSLGDFITDGHDSGGELMQLLLTKDNIECRTLPLKIIRGYPEQAAE